ncbi:hypothetical protein HFP57_07590 [Parasphingopyxis algicola]|uniref:DUF7146 domain-containing protein n=1 Tax=Parasphingopyxis algicola TaxID=2026624 RepID=UPI0015A07F1A|nr:hypothetical protein [Parasphingopyxis algicola]QLC24905.1 hypothetical protein HFP57_07590 [Parasphingopyxis algicola]
MSFTIADRARDVVDRLRGAWHGDYALCPCPVHQDDGSWLSVRIGDKAVLFHCFAGCTPQQIFAALRRTGISAATGGYRGAVPEEDEYRALVRSIWSEGTAIKGTLAEHYLHGCGIDTQNLNLRFSARMPTGQPRKRSWYPALLAPIEDATGIIALEQTFLDEDSGKTARIGQPKHIVGLPGGGAVRLGGLAEDGVLGLTTTIEDALAITQQSGHICWAVCESERYPQIAIPVHVSKIILFSHHGREAARAVVNAKLALGADGRTVEVQLPWNDGDWIDGLKLVQSA